MTEPRATLSHASTRVHDAIAWLRGPSVQAVARDLCIDSRAIRPGDVFVAVPGAKTDGRRYLGDAIAHGAAAALVDADDWHGDEVDVPVLAVAGLRNHLGAIAADYYSRPSEQLLSVGVTGTNGKTSCSQWIAQLLTREDRRCAVIGTVGIGFPGSLQASDLTTPDAVSLQREVRHLLDAGAQALAMEVSSIGLAQGRVDGMRFDVALFTNLTRDHLDVHGTMERYEAAKALLFEWPGLAHAVINFDDPAGRRIAERAAARGIDVIGYSALGEGDAAMTARLTARDIRATAEGQSFDLAADGRVFPVDVGLVGQFNIANLLGVVGVSLACGVEPAVAVAALPQLEPPPGRMQRVSTGTQPLVIVDYAHTPDALAQALVALRPLAEARGGRLWAVFGAGGDRDPGKRAPMGAAAAGAADTVVVTSDNPRTEDPLKIIEEVAAGAAAAAGELVTEPDRALAIVGAIDRAAPADVIVIAGKGHEDYQVIGSEKRPFSDLEQARAAIARRMERST